MSNSENTADAPAIRFAGFEGPWERKRLGDVGTSYSGLSGKTKEDFGHGSARFVPYTNVFDNPVSDPKRLELTEVDPKQNTVRYGDALFTVSSETPEEVGMSSVWLSDLENVYLNSFCFGYRQDGTFDSHFLAHMLRSRPIRKQLTLLAQGISRYNISKNRVMELSVPVPSLPEQKAIGSLFSRLDSLIEAEGDRLAALRATRESMLSRMFPREGESVPEVRFTGFEGPWERKRLGEVADICTGSSDAQDSDPDGEYPFFIRSDEVLRSNKYVFDCEAILVPGEGRLGDIYHYYNGKFDCHQRVYKISGFSGVLATFMIQSMKRGFKTHALRNTVKATVDSLRLPTFQSFEFSVPSLPEQRAIGSFFSRLDALIEARAMRVEMLGRVWSALLARMFG